MSRNIHQEDRCPRCATPGDFAGEDGLCPGCLLEAALNSGTAGHSDAEPAAGASCGIYQLERVIGRGGNGIVFLATRPGTTRTFAIKMLASARLAGPDELRRFRLEAEAAMELEHPNIVRVLEIGEDDGAPYFVMEHAAGGSLAERLELESEPLVRRDSLRGRIALMIAVARAVQFAHERGVLHRDLKPANILMDSHGSPMVTDFGLARLIHAPSGVTMTGAALGTPSYMAPEQAAGESVTTAADVFSLGAVLFHLLTGRPPFIGNSPLETLRLVTSTDAPDPRVSSPWIDRDLAMVCLTALRRETPRRCPSAAALADDLERWQRGVPVAARPLPWPGRCVKWSRRHPILATLGLTGGAAGVVLMMMFVAGSVMLRRERNHALYQESLARKNAEIANHVRDESRLNSYAADVYLAYRAFDDGHLGLARRMLARQNPPPGLSDLRGFEWSALARRCRGDDIRAWHDHRGAVQAVAFSPDGRWLASASRDGLVFLRSVADGSTFLSLPASGVPKNAAEIPMMAAVTARSGELKRVLLEGELKPSELRMRGRPSNLGEIATLAWSPDSSRFATAGLGSYVRVWSAAGGNLQAIIPVYTVTDLSFSHDGRFLVAHRFELEDAHRFESRIYQTSDWSLHHVIGGLQSAHALSGAAGQLATVSAGGTGIAIHDIAAASVVRSIEPSIAVRQLAFSPDGKTLWGVESAGMLAASWSVSDGRRTGSMFPIDGRIDRLCPLPDGLHMATSGSSQRLAIQHVSGATPARWLGGHEDTILSIGASPDGRWVASGGNDHTCRLWSTQAVPDTREADDPFHSDAVLPGGFQPLARAENGFWCKLAGREGWVQFVSNSGEVLRQTHLPRRTLSRFTTSPDGRILGAVSWPRGIQLYDSHTNTWGDEWPLCSGTVGPVLFSPDTRWIASGGDDNLITIRGVADGKAIATLRGHQGEILSLAVTPDGRTLVSSSKDSTLRLWHTATWRDLGTLHQGDILTNLEFSIRGNTLRATAADGSPRVFRGSPE